LLSELSTFDVEDSERFFKSSDLRFDVLRHQGGFDGMIEPDARRGTGVHGAESQRQRVWLRMGSSVQVHREKKNKFSVIRTHLHKLGSSIPHFRPPVGVHSWN